MTKSLRLRIIIADEPPRVVPEAAWIQARLADGGGIGIWPGHAPLLAETEAGPLRYGSAGGEQSLELAAGILWVDSAGVTIRTPGGPEAEWLRGAGPASPGCERLAGELKGQMRTARTSRQDDSEAER